jgi:hypothetical protein
MAVTTFVILVSLQCLIVNSGGADARTFSTGQQSSFLRRGKIHQYQQVRRGLEEELTDDEIEVWDETDETPEFENNDDNVLGEEEPQEVQQEEEVLVVVDTEDQIDTSQENKGGDTTEEPTQQTKQHTENTKGDAGDNVGSKVDEMPSGGGDETPAKSQKEEEHQEDVAEQTETKPVKEDPPTPPPVPAPTPSPIPPPTKPPTDPPTVPYKPGDDDPIQKQDAADEEVQELEQELNKEEKVARRAGGLGIFIGIVAMVFTAHQMSENPDGIYASVCRLAITISSVVIKIVCMPCRKLLGAGNPHYQGHMPISTSDYGYRNDPYRSSANAGFELS